MNYVINW